ncbi:MAG: Pr6Pr family membrane protein [Hellea sp.]|nr:Pr6Pr family membrane protein [Hellea sp.]
MNLFLRFLTGLIGAIAIGATILQVIGHLQEPNYDNGLIVLWDMIRYFTVLTNIIIGLFFVISAVKGRFLSYSWLTALTLWITIVGVVYHGLLSSDHNPVGILGITNIAHHTIVPIGTVFVWLLTKSREKIALSSPFVWLVFPLGYGLYAIARGALVDGTYPYFYMDPDIVGWAGVIKSQIGFVALFLGLGLVIRLISNSRA